MGSAAFGVFAGGISILVRSRGRAGMNRVVAFVSMRPEVMYFCGFGSGLVGCLVTKLVILIGDLGYLLEG